MQPGHQPLYNRRISQPNSSYDELPDPQSSQHSHPSHTHTRTHTYTAHPHDHMFGNISHTTHRENHTFTNISHTANRESPMGQSSSNPDQVSCSNTSSQLSGMSGHVQRNLTSTFKPKLGNAGFHNSTSHDQISPTAKYPDKKQQKNAAAASHQNTPVFQRSRGSQQQHTASYRRNQQQQQGHQTNVASHFPPEPKPRTRIRSESVASADTVEFTVDSSPPRPLSRGPGQKQSTLYDSGDESESPPLHPSDSIFDYPDAGSEHSVTPPLPPLSPVATPREGTVGPSSAPGYRTSRSKSPKTPDILRKSASGHVVRKDKQSSGRSHGVGAPLRDDRKSSKTKKSPRGQQYGEFLMR